MHYLTVVHGSQTLLETENFMEGGMCESILRIVGAFLCSATLYVEVKSR
jgi:hypothetical protein